MLCQVLGKTKMNNHGPCPWGAPNSWGETDTYVTNGDKGHTLCPVNPRRGLRIQPAFLKRSQKSQCSAGASYKRWAGCNGGLQTSFQRKK